MIIKRDSWHYRFMCGFLNFDTPKTLCTYFWSFVVAVILVLGATAMCLVALCAVSTLALHWWFPDFREEAIGTGVFLIGLGIWFLVYCQLERSMYRRRANQEKLWEIYRKTGEWPDRHVPRPNPFWEYLKNLKQKACPFLTYE